MIFFSAFVLQKAKVKFCFGFVRRQLEATFLMSNFVAIFFIQAVVAVAVVVGAVEVVVVVVVAIIAILLLS